MNAIKSANNSMPSILLIEYLSFAKKLKVSRVAIIEIAMHSGKSNFRLSLWTFTGKIRLVRPKMPNMLKMLEPMTLPIATSELPCIAPITLTTNSGNDVPMPTINAPIAKSETLYRLAMDTEPDTNKSAPNIIKGKDIIRIRYTMRYLFSL